MSIYYAIPSSNADASYWAPSQFGHGQFARFGSQGSLGGQPVLVAVMTDDPGTRGNRDLDRQLEENLRRSMDKAGFTSACDNPYCLTHTYLPGSGVNVNSFGPQSRGASEFARPAPAHPLSTGFGGFGDPRVSAEEDSAIMHSLNGLKSQVDDLLLAVGALSNQLAKQTASSKRSYTNTEGLLPDAKADKRKREDGDDSTDDSNSSASTDPDASRKPTCDRKARIEDYKVDDNDSVNNTRVQNGTNASQSSAGQMNGAQSVKSRTANPSLATAPTAAGVGHDISGFSYNGGRGMYDDSGKKLVGRHHGDTTRSRGPPSYDTFTQQYQEYPNSERYTAASAQGSQPRSTAALPTEGMRSMKGQPRFDRLQPQQSQSDRDQTWGYPVMLQSQVDSRQGTRPSIEDFEPQYSYAVDTRA